MKREPHHFSWEDFGRALFGSFIISVTFLFKGSMFDYAVKMKPLNMLLVTIFTLAIVTIEIYALSYRFVSDRKQRPFYEFWAKRFFAITISSFVIIYVLIYLYGLNGHLTNFDIFKLALAIFMPASIAGAAVEMLKKR